MKHIYLLFLILLYLFTQPLSSQTISLTDGTTYTQNFNELANSGTSLLIPTGWYFSESGTNANDTYSAGTGSNSAGDTYSFGSASSTDRALGTLLSTALSSTIGAAFTNNTGSTVTELIISYTGEQWRLGATDREDRLNFQYSLDATSLTTGNWTNLIQLDFIAPVTSGSTGALDGNISSNRTLISHTITGLNITDGSTFWIRWIDVNASGSDDGLGVDDFNLTPTLSGVATASLSVNPSTLTGFSYTSGNGPSASQIYKLSGLNLDPASGNITVIGSTNYEVSTDDVNFNSFLDIPYSNGILSETDIYVRLKAVLEIGNYNNEVISNSGGNATSMDVTVSGSVNPSATINPSLSELNGFYYVFNSGPSGSKSFSVTASGLTPETGTIAVNGPSDYEVSVDNTNFFGSVNINYNTGSINTVNVYVRLKSGLIAGDYNNELITVSGGGANSVSVTVNGVVAESPSFNNVVIAEVYGGGGNSGSPYNYDYIILYNPTNTTVDVSGWSIQYATASGTSWLKTDLTGTIQADSYYAIQQASGSGGSAELPFTPDVAGSINMSATAGKVALVSNQTALSGSDQTGNSDVIDFVGYGNSANAFEGIGPAPAPSNISSIRRKDNLGNNTYGTSGSGWDTNHNQFDFYVETNLLTNAPLPVELSSFSAKVSGKIVKLFWRTETEVNNFGFNIERKTSSGSDWVKIGFVAGSGNSNTPKEYTFSDARVSSGKYYYRLKQLDNDGSFSYSSKVSVDLGQTNQFDIDQNFPNPFNPTTSIKFIIPEAVYVRLVVFNLVGQEVKTLVNGIMEAGEHIVDFDGTDLNSGIYIYQLEAGSFRKVMKMTLIK